MEIKEKLGAIEAVLFASGEPVELYRLAEAVAVDVGTLPSLIRLINERYDSLYIHNKTDIKIEAKEICELLNRRPGKFLKEILK